MESRVLWMTYEKLLRIKRKPYNVMTILQTRANILGTKRLTIHPPARVMPRANGKGVIRGNQINNS